MTINVNSPEELIGTQIYYIDYVGMERSGHIVYTERVPWDEEQLWVYIEDEDMELNDKIYSTLQGIEFRYAELRLSSEIVIDSD